MKAFTITEENRVAVCDPKARKGQPTFATAEELVAATADFTAARLVAVWNNLPEVQPVKRFTDRKTAITRIWKTIQAAQATFATVLPASAPRKARSTKGATQKPEAHTARQGSKKEAILNLLKRDDGATLAEIIAVTDWQAHTIRGFICLTKKNAGLKIESIKRSSGDRAYTLAQ